MIFVLIGLMFGAAIAAAVYAVYRIFSEVPEDDRTYLDKPPLFYRLAWPLIMALVYYGGRFVTEDYCVKTQAALRKAGQDYTLSAEQFLAGKVLSALTFGLMTVYSLGLLHRASLVAFLMAALFGFYYPSIWLSERKKSRNLAILKSLPFFLDVLTLAVEAGLNLSNALQLGVGKSPPGPLSSEINRVLRDVRAGRPRADALRGMAERLEFPPITTFVSALVQAELMGSSLGPILRAQSEQRRSERFQRAEKLAMEAPVKMLAPLIMFIFPCTFVVLGFPIVVKFLNLGL